MTFWGDFNNNGTFETCLGTASVQVFDLEVPPEGLEYAVNLPVNLNPYRRPCEEGPRVVPIRAILSWNEVPKCGNPNWVPTWGNREETLILIPPGLPTVRETTARSSTTSAARRSAQSTREQGWPRSTGRSAARSASPAKFRARSILAIPDTLEYKVWATQGATTVPIVSPFT